MLAGRRGWRERDLLLSVVVLAVQLGGTHALARHHTGGQTGAWWGSTPVALAGPRGATCCCASGRWRSWPSGRIRARCWRSCSPYGRDLRADRLPGRAGVPVADRRLLGRGRSAATGSVALACVAMGWVVFLWLPGAIGTGGPALRPGAGSSAWPLGCWSCWFAAEAIRDPARARAPPAPRPRARGAAARRGRAAADRA